MVKMVERFSAVMRLPNEQKYAIEEDHVEMVRFVGRADRSYQTLVRCVDDVMGK